MSDGTFRDLLPLNPVFLYNPRWFRTLECQVLKGNDNDKEGHPMSRLIVGLIGAMTSVVLNGSMVLANEPKGGAPDYSGISSLYYTLIAIILIYGVYDAFFKKS